MVHFFCRFFVFFIFSCSDRSVRRFTKKKKEKASVPSRAHQNFCFCSLSLTTNPMPRSVDVCSHQRCCSCRPHRFAPTRLGFGGIVGHQPCGKSIDCVRSPRSHHRGPCSPISLEERIGSAANDHVQDTDTQSRVGSRQPLSFHAPRFASTHQEVCTSCGSTDSRDKCDHSGSRHT